jgi:HSP20 family protein
MTLVTWDPADDLKALHKNLDRMFGGTLVAGLPMRLGDLEPALVAPIDVHEDEKGLQVEMSLAGFAPEDVTIRAEPRRLVIEAATGKQAHQRDKNCIRHERFEGRIRREIALPDGVVIDKIHAAFDNGVLKISVPIDQSTTQPKQIPVSRNPQTTSDQQDSTKGQRESMPGGEAEMIGRQSQPQSAAGKAGKG